MSLQIIHLAMVSVKAKTGELILLKALIDQGSQSPFISENALQTLKLNRQKIHANVSGIGESLSTSKYCVHLVIQPRFKSSFVLNTKAIVLKKLTKISSRISEHVECFDQFNNLLLADPSFRDQSDIDIILGVIELTAIIKPGLVKSSPLKPMAQDTELGWIVSGPIEDRSFKTLSVTSLISNVELDEKLQKFFEQSDIIELDNKNETNEEIECEKHFVETHYRDEEGRYVVQMPFVDGLTKPDVGDSRKIAIACQLQLERRFKKNQK